MRASRRVLCLAFSCLSSFAAAQPSDQVLAERVLGPQWKQASRRAGMIFAGTVLTAAPQAAINDKAVSEASPTLQLRFRVDQAIAGVEPGQVLTIHEWVGAQLVHRPMNSGQRILIFLYPRSRLGLTSPVGGPLGQVSLDPSGKYVSKQELRLRDQVFPKGSEDTNRVSVVQLERAIRSAREE
jgi:hypothetical protein